MNKSLIFLLRFLAIIPLLFAQACSTARTDSVSHSTSNSNFVLETGVEVDELEVTSIMTSNHLNIKKLRLDAGQLTFRLFAPTGDVQWEKSFTAPAKFNQAFDLEAVPGIWKLEIEMENATGDYRIKWDASN